MEPGPVGACAYCGIEADSLQREHVFPKSWHPETTPEELERITVPSCGPCNRRWMRAEEELLLNLGIAIVPGLPESAGIAERLLRSMKVEAARDRRDAAKRAAKARKMLRTMKWLTPAPGQVQQDVRLPSGIVVKVTPARQIEQRLWREISEKFIRGLHFAETGEVLPEGIQFSAKAGGRLLPDGREISLDRRVAPGFMYGRVHGGALSAWRFLIWGQLLLLAVMEPGIAPEAVPVNAVARSRR